MHAGNVLSIQFTYAAEDIPRTDASCTILSIDRISKIASKLEIQNTRN